MPLFKYYSPKKLNISLNYHLLNDLLNKNLDNLHLP